MFLFCLPGLPSLPCEVNVLTEKWRRFASVGWEVDFGVACIEKTFVAVVLNVRFASDGPSSPTARPLSSPVLAMVGSDSVAIHFHHDE